MLINKNLIKITINYKLRNKKNKKKMKKYIYNEKSEEEGEKRVKTWMIKISEEKKH